MSCRREIGLAGLSTYESSTVDERHLRLGAKFGSEAIGASWGELLRQTEFDKPRHNCVKGLLMQASGEVGFKAVLEG